MLCPAFSQHAAVVVQCSTALFWTECNNIFAKLKWSIDKFLEIKEWIKKGSKMGCFSSPSGLPFPSRCFFSSYESEIYVALSLHSFTLFTFLFKFSSIPSTCYLNLSLCLLCVAVKWSHNVCQVLRWRQKQKSLRRNYWLKVTRSK